MKTFEKVIIPHYDEIRLNLLECLNSQFDDTVETVQMINGVLESSPLLNKFFVDNDLHLSYAVAFIRLPGSMIPIHIDDGQDGTHEVKFELALNLPLENTAGTYQNYYDIPVEKLYNFYDPMVKQNYRTYDLNPETHKQFIPISSIELLDPHLIRLDLPHNIINPTDKTRKVISIRFMPQPTHLWDK